MTTNVLLLQRARNFFSSLNPDVFENEGFRTIIEPFVYSDEHENAREDFPAVFLFFDFQSGQMHYLNFGSQPLCVRNTSGQLIMMSEVYAIPNREYFYEMNALFFPIREISTLFVSSNDLGRLLFEKHHASVFSKKDLLNTFQRIGEDLLESHERFSFVIVNCDIGRGVEYTRHFELGPSMEQVEQIEEELESLIEGYFEDNVLNARTILVVNELLLNAYEHGLLGISAEEKQVRMEEGIYEKYLAEREKNATGKIDLWAVFYRNGMLNITIDDHGSGFDFENYLCTTGDCDYRGRGIQMSRNIASAVFFSNQGSRVSFFVRYMLENAEMESHISISDDELLKQISILYVEDDKIIRPLFEGLIKQRVKFLYVATDGHDALRMFEQTQPDLVITDVQMPVMDGIELAKAIKNINAAIPVIFTTAHDHEAVLTQALQIGVDKILTKPVDIKKLRHALSVLSKPIYLRIRQRQKEHENFDLADLRAKNSYAESQQKKAFEKQQLIIRDESDLFRILTSYVYYQPTEILSGDMYGVFKVYPGQAIFYIIDSMGKGLVASVTAVLSAAFINRAVDQSRKDGEVDLQEIISSYSQYISEYLLAEECISISLAHIDHDKRVIKYSGFGMYSMFVKDIDSGELLSLKSHNPPFMRGDSIHEIDTMSLPERYAAVMYSDGLCEFRTFSYNDFKSEVESSLDYEDLMGRIEKHIESEEEYDSPRDDMTLIYVTSYEKEEAPEGTGRLD